MFNCVFLLSLTYWKIQQVLKATMYSYANTIFPLAPNVLKTNVKVTNWPFNNILNKFNLDFDARDSGKNVQMCNFVTQSDSSGSLQAFVANLGDSALYPTILIKY